MAGFGGQCMLMGNAATRAAAFGGLLLFTGSANAEYGFAPVSVVPTGSDPVAVAVGDVTGDGRDDVIVATTSVYDDHPENDYKIMIYVQEPDGTLRAPVKIGYPQYSLNASLVVADFDDDGVGDILLGHDAGVGLVRGSSAPGNVLENLWSGIGFRIQAVDVEPDGRLDIARNTGYGSAIILYGDGQGGISHEQAWDGIADPRFADMNGDGREDFVVLTSTYDSSDAWVYLHDSTGGWHSPKQVHVEGGGWLAESVATGDFDTNGFADLAFGSYTNSPSSIFVVSQLNSLRFAPARSKGTYEMPSALLATDMDGDGRDDLVVAHEWPGVSLYRQDAGELQGEQLFPHPYIEASAGLAVGDVNGDGRRDVVSAGRGVGLMLFLGTELANPPDLVLSLSASAAAVTAQVANTGDVVALASPLVSFDMRVRSGTMQPGMLPDGCAVMSQTQRRVRVTCLLDAVPAGTTTALVLPYTNPGAVGTRTLDVMAKAETDTGESTLANNTANARYRGSVSIVPLQHASAGMATRRSTAESSSGAVRGGRASSSARTGRGRHGTP